MHRYLKCLILLLAWFLYPYVMLYLSFLTVFVIKPILSEISVTSSALFWFPFAWNIFFYSLIFSLSVSLLKWVSCRQHIDVGGPWIFCFCFCFFNPVSHSESLTLNLWQLLSKPIRKILASSNKMQFLLRTSFHGPEDFSVIRWILWPQD